MHADLISTLDKLATMGNDDWMPTLNERKQAELSFHDQHRDRDAATALPQDTYEQLYGNRKYYDTVGLSREYTANWLAREVPGKTFLDYACGNGADAIRAAKAGAELAIGIDLSRTSLANGAADAQKAGVSGTTRFVQADCENTQLPTASIDRMICNGMLHHLDLSCAFPEIRRVLAPGGKLLAVESLEYNPLIAWYRKLTPAMRTDWEKNHILGLKDLKYAKQFFKLGEVRYWHIISMAGAHTPLLLPAYNTIDRVLTKIPGIQLMAWIFTFELIREG